MTGHQKKLGSIHIESEQEEDTGNLSIFLNDNGCIEIRVSQTHKYGMSAEIELSALEFRRVKQALEKAQNLIVNRVFHHEGYAIDTIYVNGVSTTRQGVVIVNVFEESIIFVVSLTHGGDPDIMINKAQLFELIQLFQTVEKQI